MTRCYGGKEGGAIAGINLTGEKDTYEKDIILR
jgi:hypothetical protein